MSNKTDQYISFIRKLSKCLEKAFRYRDYINVQFILKIYTCFSKKRYCKSKKRFNFKHLRLPN